MCELLKQWGQIAPGITFFVVLLGVVVAWRQLHLNRTNQRETTAKTIFREYLKFAFDNPRFAAGDYEEGSVEKYRWFVGYFLWAYEEMFAFAKHDRAWMVNLQMQAKAHRRLFTDDEIFRNELPGYTADAQKLVDDVIHGKI
jgi:hypothetical protein